MDRPNSVSVAPATRSTRVGGLPVGRRATSRLAGLTALSATGTPMLPAGQGVPTTGRQDLAPEATRLTWGSPEAHAAGASAPNRPSGGTTAAAAATRRRRARRGG